MDTKRMVKKYLEKTEIPEDQKVIIVGHGNFFMMYTGKWHETPIKQYMSEPDEYIAFDNCEFVCDPTDYSQVQDKVDETP